MLETNQDGRFRHQKMCSHVYVWVFNRMAATVNRKVPTRTTQSQAAVFFCRLIFYSIWGKIWTDYVKQGLIIRTPNRLSKKNGCPASLKLTKNNDKKKDFCIPVWLEFWQVWSIFFLNIHQLLVKKFSIETALRHKGTQNIDCTRSALADFF